MGVAFSRNQALSQNDLFIKVKSSSNTLIDPFSIKYSIYDASGGVPLLIEPARREPLRAGVGQYWAYFVIDATANIGDHLIQWYIQESPTSPEQVIEERYSVVGLNIETTLDDYPQHIKKLIKRLRIFLRDNNPDRNYHFRPPTDREVIRGYTERFGFIWEDEELYEYLLGAVDTLVLSPPQLNFTIDSIPANWETLVVRWAAVYALRALTLNWVEEEFGYSIQGISLDIDKSSKYAAQADTLATEVKEMTETAKSSIKIIKGLHQSKFRVGAQGVLGPGTGTSKSTNPRSFMGGGLGTPQY